MAMQIKLDELIRAMEGAHNVLLDLEELDDETLARHRARYRKLAEDARKQRERGENDVGGLDIEPEAEPDCATQP